MKIGIHNGSGLGDILMSLPLLYGLKAQGHEVWGIGNNSTRPLYNFLSEQKILAGAKIYQSHSLSAWRKEIRDLDRLLLVGYFGLGLNPLGLFRIGLPVLRPFLSVVQNIREISYMETAWVQTVSSKSPRLPSRPLTYIHCLEKNFGGVFKPETLFFQEDVLKKARLRAEKTISDQGLRAHQYAVLYPATRGDERNIPLELLNEIIRYLSHLGLKLILIGDPSHGGYPPLRDANLIDWRGRRDFEELVGLFSLSRVVFAVDGGLLHLALASRAKTVSFWGPTLPESRVVSNHPYHRPLCRYLPFQPYEGEKITDAQRAEVFNFSIEEIAKAAL